MDSNSPLFPTQGSLLSVLYFAAWFFGALAAIVGLAMILVTARYYLGYDDDEVMVLSTKHPPPAVVGRWQPVTAPTVHRKPYRARFVTVVVRNDIGMMPIVIELKQWRMVLAVKLHVYYATGYLLTHQRLSHQGERLDDYCQLDDYGWRNGQCVELKVDLLVAL